MKVSDYISNYIKKQGIDYVFGYIGGAITHLVDSFYKTDGIEFIQVYHEQTASFAVEGFSRNSDKIGIALATSGPGATNLITGIADAYFDSIPTIFITGQVNTYEYKYTKTIRQQGFQETDIVSIVSPITKYAKLIDHSEDIAYELEKAFYLAKEGRPGPILLDIPMDVQRAEIDPDIIKHFSPEPVQKDNNEKEKLESIKKLISQSPRPVILAGGGVISSKAEKELLSFSEKYQIPVVTSLMGKGSFPEDHNFFVGYIGSYGHRCANMVLANSDLLIAVGTRLSTRQTGTLLSSFLRDGKIIHVDIDKNELTQHRLKRDIQIQMDAKDFFVQLTQKLNENKIEMNRNSWFDYINKIRNELSHEKEIEKNVHNQLPYQLLSYLNQLKNPFDIYTVDIGHNQIMSVQTLTIKENQKFFTSGGMAPMGYAVPVAIGASFAWNHQKKILAIAGDGGFHISIQALMLISQYKLPIKTLVINNKSLGMIVQFQDLYFDKKEYATTQENDYLVPDFEKISSAYNLNYYSIDKKTIHNLEYLDKIFNEKAPAIIELVLDEKTTVSPKLEVNNPIEETSPKLDKNQFESLMFIKPLKKEEK
ncbi:MAG: hypothetical protein A2Y41_06495 [Spirochaetes bacterium GWB1_36_13]|nr:MAG: hypothetical protein A2Y41_06495 [Spirochaetes bacterium GWB1_36_13]